MTNEVNKTGEQGKVEETGLPNPQFSEPAPVSSTSALTPEAVVELLSKSPIFDELLERKLQGTKDKRFSKLQQNESTMKEVVSLLKSQGVAIPKELEQEITMRDYIDERLKSVAPTADNGISAQVQPNQSGFNVVDAIKDYGLDANDPEVLKLVGGKYRNADHLRLELATYAIKTSKKSAPSDTVVASQPGQGVSGEMSDDEKNQAYTKLDQMYKFPTKFAPQIKELEKKLGIG